MTNCKILYCHCAHAQVVPADVKQEVLRRLCDAGVEFEAVADLCEMSARREPSLVRLAESGALKVAACYPRAVRWLFSACKAPLNPASTEVLNMRTQPAAEVYDGLVRPGLVPNLPTGQVVRPAGEEAVGPEGGAGGADAAVIS